MTICPDFGKEHDPEIENSMQFYRAARQLLKTFIRMKSKEGEASLSDLHGYAMAFLDLSIRMFYYPGLIGNSPEEIKKEFMDRIETHPTVAAGMNSENGGIFENMFEKEGENGKVTTH